MDHLLVLFVVRLAEPVELFVREHEVLDELRYRLMERLGLFARMPFIRGLDDFSLNDDGALDPLRGFFLEEFRPPAAECGTLPIACVR